MYKYTYEFFWWLKSITFLKLTGRERRFFIEAACETLRVHIAIIIRGTLKYASRQGQHRVETEAVAFDAQQTEQVLQIKKAVIRCRHLVWAHKCSVVSIAGKRMLNRRQIPATLYLGVAKDEKGKLIAHAWLRSGNIWVSGGRNRHQFTVVGFFSWCFVVLRDAFYSPSQYVCDSSFNSSVEICFLLITRHAQKI